MPGPAATPAVVQTPADEAHRGAGTLSGTFTAGDPTPAHRLPRRPLQPGPRQPGPQQPGPQQPGPQQPSARALGPDLLWSAAFPGAGTTIERHRLLAALLLTGGVLAPLALVAWVVIEGNGSLKLVMNDRAFSVAVAVSAVALAARLVAVSEVLAHGLRRPSATAAPRRRAPRTATMLQATTAYLLVALITLPMAFGVARAKEARDFLDTVFVTDRTGVPLFTASTAGVPVEGAAPSGEASSPSAGPGAPGVNTPDAAAASPRAGGAEAATDLLLPLAPLDPTQIHTVLLLGGDGAPGRPGNRTDSMMLVMIDRHSGRVGLVSVPRNLMRLRFPPGTPLAERHPDGFPDLANAIFTAVDRNRDLSAAYGRNGLLGPAVAVSEAVGYSLGITIDDYLFVDMRGFSDLIDAVGGVSVYLDRAHPIPPNVADPGRPVPPSVGPGWVRMDGPLAMGYARTRYLDSDVARTSRQRELLTALAQQTSAAEVAVNLPAIIASLNGAISTSMSRDRLLALLEATGGSAQIAESVSLVPPLVNANRPDWAEAHRIVAATRDALVTGIPSGYSSG